MDLGITIFGFGFLGGAVFVGVLVLLYATRNDTGYTPPVRPR